jgi:hypothetical protein
MTKDTRINVWNIVLMLISCAAAFVMPFEVFLFAYAVLGPLHYLTEISWLHDRKYYAQGKYDYLFLLIIGIIITWDYMAYRYQLWPYADSETGNLKAITLNIGDKFLLIAFFGAIVLAFVKNLWVKLGCLLLIFAFVNSWLHVSIDEEGKVDRNDSTFLYVLTSLVPTLIHVYVFTGFFILFGALKSRSISGLISFVVFVVCPLLLILLFQHENFVPASEYGRSAFGNTTTSDGFFDLSQSIMDRFMGIKPDETALNQQFAGLNRDQLLGMTQKIPTEVWTDWVDRYNLDYTSTAQFVNLTDDGLKDLLRTDFLHSTWNQFVYNSSTGILLMRFIAFAYLYHYLNWFSKTEVIKWHQVPKVRLIAIAALWLFSLGIYAYDYALGLQWLFFLSFSHVLLEFPLNYLSIVGIGKETVAIVKGGFKAKSAT